MMMNARKEKENFSILKEDGIGREIKQTPAEKKRNEGISSNSNNNNNGIRKKVLFPAYKFHFPFYFQ